MMTDNVKQIPVVNELLVRNSSVEYVRESGIFECTQET